MTLIISPLPDTKQRIDKWLWFARVVKTRSLAARLVADGHVRRNGMRIDTPAHKVAVGDHLTIALERTVRVLKVLAPGERRGPYLEACQLYEDLTPAAPDVMSESVREPGAGRPTKKQRRDLSRLQTRD